MNQEALNHVSGRISEFVNNLSNEMGINISFTISDKPHQNPYSVIAIAHKLAEIHGYTLEALRQKQRTKHLSTCRMSAIYLLSKYAGCKISMNEIGKIFNHHYSTVVNAIKTANTHRSTGDKTFCKINILAETEIITYLKNRK